jgi:protein involved in polysaccharide export with SLBB domain
MVYVMGAVGVPGPHPIRPGDRLLDILGRAGGVSGLGNANAIMVYRGDTLRPGDARVQLINLRTGLTKEQLREVIKAAKAGDQAEILDGEDAYSAQDGDVIMVPGRALGGQPNYLVEALRTLLMFGLTGR